MSVISLRLVGVGLVVGSFSLFACDKDPATSPVSPGTPAAAVSVSSVTITGESQIRGLNKTLQLTAVVAFSDGTTADQTTAASWSTSKSVVATVSNTGLVTSRGLGVADIRASYQGVRGNSQVRVERIGPPSIEFTFVPAKGTFDNLRGRVLNVDLETHRVVVYIQAWRGWWIKPYFSRPLTSIRPDGTWTTDITTGGIDETASEIIAFLVTDDHESFLAGGASRERLPKVNGEDVLAMVEVTR